MFGDHLGVSRHIATLLRLPKLQTLTLRDVFSLREAADALSRHPSLQDVLIQCTSASEQATLSIFRMPQVSVFRCNGFQYDVPAEVRDFPTLTRF